MIVLSISMVLAQVTDKVFLPLILNNTIGNLTPTATPAVEQTATPTVQTATVTITPIDTPRPTSTAINTAIPTNTVTQVHTSTNTPTSTPTNTATVTPTPTSTATSTPTNTSTQTHTPTNTPTPAVSILANNTSFVDISNNLHIVGQVENRSANNVEFVKITANVFNASNQLVAVDFAFTMLRVLTPNQQACYHIVMPQPANWTHYELEGTYVVGGVTAPSLTKLSVTTGYDGTGVPKILGQIRNDGNGRANSVQAIGTLFNVNNKVIGCDSAYVSSTNLNSGQTSSFQINFWPYSYPPIDTFSLQAYGIPQ